MEISAYLCRRNPLHAAGGARPIARAAPTPPAATGKAHRRSYAGEQHQRGSARPQLGQAPAPTELAAPKNSPAQRGSTTQKLNVIKTHTNMTTLDLNAYGVTEMSHAEKVENDGGWLWAVVGVAIYIYDNWDDIKEGLSKGYEDQGKEY